MRKIVQILYDHTSKSSRPLYLVLCDDGTVWRQTLVENAIHVDPRKLTIIVDPTYHIEWERALEFAIPKEWTPDDENERGR